MDLKNKITEINTLEEIKYILANIEEWINLDDRLMEIDHSEQKKKKKELKLRVV